MTSPRTQPALHLIRSPMGVLAYGIPKGPATPRADATEAEGRVKRARSSQCSHRKSGTKRAFHHPRIRGIQKERPSLRSRGAAHNLNYLVKSKPSRAADIKLRPSQEQEPSSQLRRGSRQVGGPLHGEKEAGSGRAQEILMQLQEK